MIANKKTSKKVLQVGLLAVGMFVLIALSATTNAFASSLKYGVMTTGSNAGGFPSPNSGDTIVGSAATNDASITKVKFRWIDPTDSTQQEHTIITSTPAGGASCLTIATKYTAGVSQSDVSSGADFKCFADSFTIPATAGDWGMQALFCSADDTCVHPDVQATRAISFDVSIFVVPESPIGTAALIMSSLGALGAFMYLRNRNTILPMK